jgi:hypothetical protein
MSLLVNSTTAKTNWDLDPRTFPDCQIWFDAADTSTLTLDETTVKTWRNKGSLNMNAIQDTGTCTSGNTVNGLNYITCPAGAHLSFTCALTAQARSVFVVARNTTQLTGSNFWGPLNQTAGAGQMSVVVSRTSALVITFPADMGPSGFGANGISAGANGPNPFGQVNVYAFVQSSTATANNALTINGTPSMITSNLAANYNINSVKYIINTAGYNTGSDICEILYYNRDVSVIERRAIEGYLMWKWGLKRQNEVAFSPTSIANCALWYDADVDFTDATSRATSFTFSSTSPVGTVDSVQVWKDRSGNGRDATFLSVAGSSARPILTANRAQGKCAVVFNGANALNNTYSLATDQAHTLFVVAAPNQNGFRAVVSLNSYPGLRGNMLVVYQSSGNIWRYSGATAGTDGYSTALAAAANRYDILSNYWSPSSSQINLNGHFVQTSAAAPSSLRATSTMLIGAVPGSSTAPATNSTLIEFWSGGIAEIILYTATLTVDQRNQVERYLSLKWNRPLVNACALGHPNKWVPAFTRAFNPTDIASCSGWFDAADTSTIDLSVNSITQWRDKSGFAYNATPQISGTTIAPTFSNNGVVFAGNSVLNTTLPNSLLTQMTYFVVGSVTNAAVGQDLIAGNAPNGSTNRVWFVSVISGNQRTAAYGGTVVNTGAALTSNVRFLYNGTLVSAGTSNMYLNGTLTNTRTGTLTYTGIGTTTIGGYIDGSNPNGAGRLGGTINEVIIYNTALDPGQIQRVEGYLSDKWGSRASLPNSHPAYYNPTEISDVVNFVPTSITGCRLWLDASDTSTINSGAGIAAGGEVATWGDKSGNAIMVGNLGGTQCTWNYSLNKLPAVLMNKPFIGGFGSGSLTNFQHTTFIVTLLNSTPTAGFPCFQMATNGTTTPTNALNALDVSTTFRTTIITGGTSYPATRPASALSTPFLWRSTYDGINTLTIRRNSDSADIASSILGTGMPTTNATSFYIGGRFNDSTATWPGHISEIIVYNTVLSPANALLVERYLARKWGLTQIIPAANRFTNPGTIPSTPQIFPTTFANVAVWLDAADPDADGIPPATGTVLERWMDKSGTGIVAQQSTPSQCADYQIDTRYPSLQFIRANSDWYLSISAINAGVTYNAFSVFIAFRPTVTSATTTIFMHSKDAIASVSSTTGRYSAIRTNLSPPQIIATVRYNSTTVKTCTSNVSSITNSCLVCIADDGLANTSPVLYTNGTAATTVLTGATAVTGTDSGRYVIGGQFLNGSVTDHFNGFIYEIIFIPRQTGTQERTMIEGYLAWKWGIQERLPATHPYYKFSP